MSTRYHLDENTVFAPIRGLYSLRQTHADDVQAALASFAPNWSLEQHDDYDGNLMLVITVLEDQLTSASHLLHANCQGIHLVTCNDDTVTPIGSFASMALAVGKLQTVITSASKAKDEHVA